MKEIIIKIKQLREQTGASYTESKKYLEKADENGDRRSLYPCRQPDRRHA